MLKALGNEKITQWDTLEQDWLQVRINEKRFKEKDSPMPEKMLFNTRYTKMLDCYDAYFDIERIGNSSACHF